MIVGGRFVCVSCRLRGPVVRCPGCDGERLDLTAPGTAAALDATWLMSGAYRAGVSVLSPWSIRFHRKLLLGAGAIAAFSLVGSMIAATIHELTQSHPRFDGAEAGGLAFGLLVSLVLSLLLLAPLTVFYAAYGFYAAHVFRLIASVTSKLFGLSPVGSARFGIVAFLSGALARLVLPVIELDGLVGKAADPDIPKRAGVLRAPATVYWLDDGWAWMQRSDGWLDDLAIEEAGEPLVLHLAHGRVGWSLRSVSLTDAGKHWLLAGTTRLAPGSAQEGIVVPPWLDGHGRDREIRKTVVPAGTPVSFVGGVAVDGGLRGTAVAPLHVELG